MNVKTFSWMINVSVNRIQSKDHRKGTYEITKVSLSCPDDKLCIYNIGCGGLAVVHQR